MCSTGVSISCIYRGRERGGGRERECLANVISICVLSGTQNLQTKIKHAH